MRRSLHVAVALATYLLGLSAAGLREAARTPPAPTPRVTLQEGFARAPSGEPAAAAEREIREIIRRYDLAQSRHDAAFFREIEADGFVLMQADGRALTRDEAIADMLTWPKDLEYTSGDVEVRVYGDVAVVTSRCTARRLGSGDALWQGRWLDLFVRHSGRWQILSTAAID